MVAENTALETEDLLEDPPFELDGEGQEEDTLQEEHAKEKIRARVARRPNKASRQLRDEREESLMEFLNGIGSSDEMRIFVDRKMPKSWIDPVTGRTHSIEGRVNQFDEAFTEEELKERHGGGKYAIHVQMPNANGKYTYVAHKTVKIAGDPNVSGIIASAAPREEKKSEDNGAVKMAMDAMKSVMDREGRGDPMATQLVQNMAAEMRDLRQSLADKDQKLLDLIGKKPESTQSDRLLEIMMSGESTRLDSLRAMHATEVSTMRERQNAEIDRTHGFYRDQAANTVAAHTREVDSIRRSYDSQIEQLKLAHQGVVNGHLREIKHLDTLLDEAKAELVVLRAQKQKSPIEQLQEVAALKESLSEVFGSGDDKEEGGGSTIERVLETVAPILQGIGNRISDGPGMPGQQMQQQQPAIQPGQVVKTPDGRVVGRDAQGNPIEVRKKKKPTVEVQGGEKLTLNPDDLKAAIKFMETAFANRQEPQVFASAVRHMIPPSVQKAFAADKQGVDHFLDEVANLEPTSPLATQAGRSWLREVAKHVF